MRLLYSILILLSTTGLVSSEIFNFDYKQHGDDWFDSQGDSWKQCGSQIQQSPIQITDGLSTNNESLLFTNFKKQTAIIYYYNTTIYIRASNIVTLFFGQVYTSTILGHTPAFKANQIRLRSHSQHKINGLFYDLELQIFCQQLYASSKNQRLALSLMFQVGNDPDPALQIIIDNYVQGTVNVNASIDFSHLLNKQIMYDYWFYLGSGTIPPCYSAGLNWIVFKRTFTMSQTQRDFFYTMFNNDNMSGNWRNLQPINNNPVNFYHYSLP